MLEAPQGAAGVGKAIGGLHFLYHGVEVIDEGLLDLPLPGLPVSSAVDILPGEAVLGQNTGESCEDAPRNPFVFVERGGLREAAEVVEPQPGPMLMVV